jgi:hypothetical protein
MAWLKTNGDVLLYWDGSDYDFPRMKRGKGCPLFGYAPIVNHGENVERAVEGGELLDGISTTVAPLRPTASDAISSRLLRRSFEKASLGYIVLQVDGTNGKRRALFPNNYFHGIGKWIPIGTDYDGKESDPSANIRAHNSTILYSRFSWNLTLRVHSEDVGIRIPTDSTGARFVLRDREKNTSRRSPLLHWVTEYARRNRVNEEAADEVRSHLRGSRKCNWRGYLVEIRESELERENLVNAAK